MILDIAHMLPDLGGRFAALERQRAELLERFAGMEREVWERRPAPGSWSIAEVAHHLVLVEREIVEQFRRAAAEPRPRRGIRDRLGALAVATALRFRWRVRVPMRSMVPEPARPLEEIRTDWDRVRAELTALLAAIGERDRSRLVFRHPIGGWMDVETTLDFIEKHTTHHLPQVERAEGAHPC